MSREFLRAGPPDAHRTFAQIPRALQARTLLEVRQNVAGFMSFRFDTAPKRIYWELTRACDLACAHCRANANGSVDPWELSTSDVIRVVDELAAESSPTVIFTGGDPLKRPDFLDIVRHTVRAGLPCLVAPSATPLLTGAIIGSLASLGVSAMSLSLDGSTPSRHDGLRGVAGTFDRTVSAARQAVSLGIPLQINTLVTADTLADLPAVHRVVQYIGARRWSLFFLIQTGRGRGLRQITPAEAEAAMNWVLDLRHGPPLTTTTEAPHFRRIALMRQAVRASAGPRRPLPGLGIRDGNGVMFISHRGEIHPSGFLPLSAGNVRTDGALRTYRSAKLFCDLRQTDRFTGRCGVCPFRNVCGGSRARAYATTGDPLGSDPLCAYIPSVRRVES
jgi:radical SAM protein with 4Fe4S-binding SPASM domain